jgi:TolB-like protein/Tfp pilus assembly protein PilF
MSSDERWLRLRATFQAALERPADERDAVVRDACGNDEALRDEVHSLLAAHEAAGGFLETPAVRVDAPVAPPPSLMLRPGDRLGGRFEVADVLGAGGMGEVYRAHDLQLGREVAIKILPRAFAADPQRLARFERESRVLASLKHPNIAAIHSLEDVDGLRILVLELIEGQTLAERLSGGPVPVGAALAIAQQLAGALQAAHARGIVHRDLKPANVKLSPSGHVTLLDFGLAKAGVGDDAALPAIANAGLETTAGLVIGTCGYMSPEQARGQPTDKRADIWAFGCILFELLAGRPVFQRATPSDTIAAVLEHTPDWTSLPDGLPAAVRRLLRRCLEKDQNQRLHDIADARLDIDEALQDEAGDSAAGPAGAMRLRPARGLLAVLLLAAAGMLGWWARALVTPAASPAASAPRPSIASLAVLPFENRRSDPGADYLGDEIAESLIGQMSRIPSLTVMARGTSFRFRGAADARGAGQALDVGAVLSGTVARRGDQLIISAELLDVRSGARLWGDTFDRPFADILQVQDRIAAEIAAGLGLHLSAGDQRLLAGQGTGSSRAFDLVMKARHVLQEASEEGDLEARRLFEQAVESDPSFVEAHLGIAATYVRSAGAGFSPPGEALARADDAVARALALDPGNVRARAIRGVLLHQRDWNWPAAERELTRVRADPRLFYGTQYHGPAMFFWSIGRPDESAAILERALKTDPGNLESRVMLCDFVKEAGRLDEALRCYRGLIESIPTDSRPWFGLAEILRRRADLSGAIEALRSAYQAAGETDAASRLATARTEEDYRSAELSVVRAQLDDLRALARERYVSPVDLARLHARLGARESAFRELGRALAERSPMLVFLKVDRAYDPIRHDPRFATLVRQVGIP